MAVPAPPRAVRANYGTAHDATTRTHPPADPPAPGPRTQHDGDGDDDGINPIYTINAIFLAPPYRRIARGDGRPPRANKHRPCRRRPSFAFRLPAHDDGAGPPDADPTRPEGKKRTKRERNSPFGFVERRGALMSTGLVELALTTTRPRR